MPIKIRPETSVDHPEVAEIIEAAFRHDEHSDHQEQLLVERLRHSASFVPELAMVAETDGRLVGHILLTKVKIKNGTAEYPSLALAPVSVLPECQGRGIGSQLIREAHQVARQLGFTSIVLVGHAAYYPRFGYERLSQFGIRLPFDVPDENAMAIELIDDALKNVSGEVVYDAAFLL